MAERGWKEERWEGQEKEAREVQQGTQISSRICWRKDNHSQQPLGGMNMYNWRAADTRAPNLMERTWY